MLYKFIRQYIKTANILFYENGIKSSYKQSFIYLLADVFDYYGWKKNFPLGTNDHKIFTSVADLKKYFYQT